MAGPDPSPPPGGDAPSPWASSLIPLLAMILVFGAVTGGVFWFQSRKADEVKNTGFDFDRVEASAPAGAPAAAPWNPQPVPVPPAAPSAQPQQQSGLSMITGGSPGMFGGAPAEKAAQPDTAVKAAGLTSAVRKNEGVFRALYAKYVKKYPVFTQYKKEWASHPELAAAKEQWFRDKDPVAFVKAVSDSPNLMPMIKKYATQPEMQQFLRQAATSAPSDVMGAVSDYLNADGHAMGLFKKFAAASGLPPALLAGFTGEKVDPNKAAAEMMSGQNLGGLINSAGPPRR